MQNTRKIRDDVFYIGGSDRRLALFENAYPLDNGMSYNSYLVMDEQTVLLDTVDASIDRQFTENLAYALAGRSLDYVFVDHMEPDHCATLDTVLKKYPQAQVIGTMQVAKMIRQYYGLDVSSRFRAVKEGEELNTGKHTFRFIMAPMVHWPEVMMTYDTTDKTLYSADAFGTFGALSGNLYNDETDAWHGQLSEARRYYANIVGKYGTNVQAVLKKASALDIQMICPLHGPLIRKDLEHILKKYDLWSSYTPEDKEDVVIFYGSIYGGTENAADILAGRLADRGLKNIRMYDISKTHPSYLIAEAFRAGKLVLASPTLDAALFPAMESLLMELRGKNLQNRTVALMENGTWAPMAAKQMRTALEPFKNLNILEAQVSIRSRADDAALAAIDTLADALTEVTLS